MTESFFKLPSLAAVTYLLVCIADQLSLNYSLNDLFYIDKFRIINLCVSQLVFSLPNMMCIVFVISIMLCKVSIVHSTLKNNLLIFSLSVVGFFVANYITSQFDVYSFLNRTNPLVFYDFSGAFFFLISQVYVEFTFNLISLSIFLAVSVIIIFIFQILFDRKKDSLIFQLNRLPFIHCYLFTLLCMFLMLLPLQILYYTIITYFADFGLLLSEVIHFISILIFFRIFYSSIINAFTNDMTSLHVFKLCFSALLLFIIFLFICVAMIFIVTFLVIENRIFDKIHLLVNASLIFLIIFICPIGKIIAKLFFGSVAKN